MKHRTFFPALLILTIAYFQFGMTPEQTYTLHVKITNIRNSKGRIQLQIYKDQASFAKETPWRTKLVTKEGLTSSTMEYDVPYLPAGTYGIAILDDENRNAEMDYSFMMPKEGFGFSDYYHTSWSKPTFSDFKFSIPEKTDITVKVRYV